MDPRRLSPIDHIDRSLLDAFVQSALPDLLIPLQRVLVKRLPAPSRLAVIWLDEAGTGILTCIDSHGRHKTPGEHDTVHVDDSPTLRQCLGKRRLVRSPSMRDPLVRWVAEDSSEALLCLPLVRGDECLGALMLLQQAGAPLPGGRLTELVDWAPLMAELLVHEIDAIHGLFGAVRFARDFTLMRDTETGQHQLRIGGYAGLLARVMGQAHGMNDSFAQEIALYAPLHDIGKIGIPDEILLKPGKFDEAERERMKAHVTNGAALIDRLVQDFRLEDNPRVGLLRAVVAWHHEYVDGSGYPEGRSGDDIPLETRIITITDIFDALTNVRAYKQRWSLDDAFDLLKSMAGKQLDREAVHAFISERKQITAMWQHYAANGV
ncbi:HD-GYP domain-containing protein [Denitromonas iodatirespirans]|uniref:HD domain-containing protein n=1 Tax=Denitromonas iodatirespirans TaxID=2795389 RepID=A0A944D8T9_DENI1|nr:HD domain-containing phosphohydrolase [Denitromonas iodatirespirans]MBT0962250.1 HD domain-containing protein [Denitromonas iodatirespirans]